MKRFLRGLAVMAPLSAALAVPSMALAQTTAEVEVETEVEAEAEAPDYNTGAFTLSGGVDWTCAYFFRGYNQEDSGLILQPFATLSTPIIEDDDFTLNAYVGIWNSFHSKKSFQGDGGPSTWYESDLFGGLDFVMGKWTIGTLYTFYTYPNGSFQTIQEWGFKVAYDDTEYMEDKIGFALKPYAGIYFETKDGNGSEDTYLELGVTPSWALGESGVTLSVPVVLGLSVDDYYLDDDGDDELLGYSSVGLFASLPLEGIPARYGAWSLTGGIQWLQLYADSAQNANGGDESEFIAKVGLGFSY